MNFLAFKKKRQTQGKIFRVIKANHDYHAQHVGSLYLNGIN